METFMERGAGVYKDGPQLIYRAAITPKPYQRRVRWATIAMLASGGVFYMLGLPMVSEAIANFDLFAVPVSVVAAVLLGGRVAALLVLLLSASRAAVNLVRVFRRKPERVMFYDEGFVWQRPNDKKRTRWNAVKSVRENPRRWRVGKRTLLAWGHVTFKLRDGSLYRLTPAHTDLYAFLAKVRPHYADALGTRMAQRARQGQSFRVHPGLAVTPEGVVVDGKQRVGWANLHVRVEGRELIISHIQPGGAPRPVKRYPTHEVDNLAGLLDFVEMTSDNFQRETYYG